MAKMTARDRFLLRVHGILEERDLNQKDLRGTNSEGWISNKLRGKRNLTLNEAEEIADALPVPLTELLRRPENAVYELDNLEARLLEAFRQLAKQEQDAFLTIITLRHRAAPYATGRKMAPRTPLLGASAHGASLSTRRAAAASIAEDVRTLVTDFEQRLAEAIGDARQQTPTPSRPITGSSKHR
jgi:hypothetical protein